MFPLPIIEPFLGAFLVPLTASQDLAVALVRDDGMDENCGPNLRTQRYKGFVSVFASKTDFI